MAGIYIHIPFCKSKCYYCNFYSVASSRYYSSFIPVLLKEAELQKNYLEGEKINTVYFGGGTPSLLDHKDLMHIMDKLQECFEISADAEISFEANPDDLNNGKIKELEQSPVNRISIGIQSFFDDDLKYLKRIHSASQAESAVKRCQDAGLENISIDLIYGIPTLTDDKWKINLDTSFSLAIPHISAYGLTVETKTALETLISKGKALPVNEEQSVRQFKILMQQMKTNYFIHYEISNFCKEGFISKHNSNYWKGSKYLGLGPSAHSYNLLSRQWNVADISEYIEKIEQKKVPAEIEILSNEQKLNEYIMTSLRTIWGCDINYIEQTFGSEHKNSLISKAENYISKGHIIFNNNILVLTDEGKLFADGIAGDLFE
ncbi:MAG: radical SAM family heme chaperone HemW [Bacteroidetes bacterium]|nr:radical SAM family heme chaperone HemW [Bacteroidota bacterium]